MHKSTDNHTTEIIKKFTNERVQNLETLLTEMIDHYNVDMADVPNRIERVERLIDNVTQYLLDGEVVLTIEEKVIEEEGSLKVVSYYTQEWEEVGVRRDIEWLKERVKHAYGQLKDFNKRYYGEVKVMLLDDVNELIDQLEEPEITEEQAWEVIERENHYHIAPSQVKEYRRLIRAGTVLDDVVEKVKPVIPQFVADFIDEYKGVYNLFGTMRHIHDMSDGSEEVYSWMYQLGEVNNRMNTFARAWLDGYEVEREQKYYVLDKEDATLLKKSAAGEGVAKSVGTNIYNVKSWKDEEKYQLTEQEIKEYDERFWAFAEEVTE